jgi:hypothetical protein
MIYPYFINILVYYVDIKIIIKKIIIRNNYIYKLLNFIITKKSLNIKKNA